MVTHGSLRAIWKLRGISLVLFFNVLKYKVPLDSVTLQGHATSRNTLNDNHKRKRKTVQKEKEGNKNERRIFPVR